MDLVQIKLDRDSGNLELLVQERKEFKKYIDLCKVEECLALQKSRVQWLGLGDRNSRLFFRSVKSNINRGKILSVDLGDGTRSTESAVIHDTFVQFYTSLFVSSFKDQYNGLERIQSLVKTKVSASQLANLARPVSDAEIKEVFGLLKLLVLMVILWGSLYVHWILLVRRLLWL